jgi:probable addiction module antidote protein
MKTNHHKIKQLTGSYKKWLIDSLKNKKEATIYLQVALQEYQEDGNTAAFLLALRQVTEAQGGIGALADKTQLNRENLYRTLAANGNPKLQTLGTLLKALGFELTIKTKSSHG